MQKAFFEWVKTVVGVSAFALPVLASLPAESVRQSPAYYFLKGATLLFGSTVMFGSITIFSEVALRRKAANCLREATIPGAKRIHSLERVEPKGFFWFSEKAILVTWHTAILSTLAFTALFW